MRIAALMLFVGFGCCWLGFYAGRGSRADLRAERDAALAARPDDSFQPAPAGTCVAALSPDVLRAELTRALAAAGAVAPEGARAVAPPATKQPTPPPRSPEQMEAVDRARVAVDRALAHGNLTKLDALELRAQLQDIADDESRFQLTTRLVVALNQKKLQLEDGQFPF